MSLFKNLFKPPAAKPAATPKAAPASSAPPPAQYPPVPPALPKIGAPKAGQIAQSASPSPGAQQILAANPQQTPSEYLSALQKKQMGEDMVKTMAHSLPDREGVHWAAQSAEKVSDKLPPQEQAGMKAAQAWAKNPTPENQAAAAAAAAQGGCRGPGSLAAQGAAWSQPPGAGAAGTTATPRLTPEAVSGAVLMASAIKANPTAAVPAMAGPALGAPATTPVVAVSAAPQTAATVPAAVQAETFKQQQPFIQMGLDIASGKTSVG